MWRWTASSAIAQVRREVDFRNAEILHVFLTATGRLPARRKSKLKQSTHRFMCRQIKVTVARVC